MRRLIATGFVDDIITGNFPASEEEFAAVAAVGRTRATSRIDLEPGAAEVECGALWGHAHTTRGDASAYMLRSSWPRLAYRDTPIPARATLWAPFRPRSDFCLITFCLSIPSGSFGSSFLFEIPLCLGWLRGCLHPPGAFPPHPQFSCRPKPFGSPQPRVARSVMRERRLQWVNIAICCTSLRWVEVPFQSFTLVSRYFVETVIRVAWRRAVRVQQITKFFGRCPGRVVGTRHSAWEARGSPRVP